MPLPSMIPFRRPGRAVLAGLAACVILSAAPEPAAAAAPDDAPQAAASKAQTAPQAKPAAAPTAPAGLTRIRAQRWERIGDKMIADGEVEIRYKSITLFADHVELDEKTKDVLAVGAVALHFAPEEPAVSGAAPPPDAAAEKPPAAAAEVISADRLEFNLDSARGKMQKAFGLIQPSLFFSAETLERSSELVYGMGPSTFTACSQANPRWKFSCARANLKKDDYIEMWGAKFMIKGIPLLYWPYMRYPLNRERATGFLNPEIGYSGTKGFYLSESFYWAMARNMDSTFQVDYYGGRGLGGGLEWRYMFRGGTGGSLNLFYFDFNKDSVAAGNPDNAYLVRWSHNQTLPGGFTLAADVDYQSNYDFLREFDNNFRRATVSNRRSQVFVSKSWSKLSFNVRASQFETYFPEYGGPEGNSIITRYLPQISLNSYKIKVAGPVYFSFASAFTRWQYGWKTDYDAGNELRTQSFTFAPALNAPWSAFPWLSINAGVFGNLNRYWQTYEPFVEGQTGARKIVDDPIWASNYGLSLDLVGPVFYRIYEARGGTLRIKHLIEPSVSYRYESPMAGRDRVVSAYGFFRYHQLSYGLTNRLYFKEVQPGQASAGGPAREVLTFGLSQIYYLAPEDSPLSYYLVDGRPPEFSEIQSYLRFFPSGHFSIDFNAAINPYYKNLSSVRLGAGLGLPTDNFFLNVGWFKSINAWLKGAAEAGQSGSSGSSGYIPLEYSSLWDRHQINFYGGFKLPALNLEGRGEVNYNIIENKLLYVACDFVYHYQCVDLRAEIRIFYFRDKPETRFNFSFDLGNIGRSGSLLGGLGF